jgi:hypothetical protein
MKYELDVLAMPPIHGLQVSTLEMFFLEIKIPKQLNFQLISRL